ncbi:agmatine deiminase family protein [Geobacter hydrogenophilus]|uniref:Agmatine deiminase n=1 Tax=Geobacter hydrogenophilus TaxID=40983 RepID=A0A9W6LCB7_9BACT|nr:agmatine deiminase family protein [Geobacter hydrogenophilus]MBT0892784.1 agmatine deiminase family protein [Geobacter hydrogenophilus]GLI38742.1 agmatine deiminase [Geobacter hydrogenophilus]
MILRFPAEWEKQDGVLLAWPHAESDWLPWLPMVELVFAQIVKEITRFETALVVAADRERTAAILSAAGARIERVRIEEIPTNDTWARDFGPLTVERDGAPVLLDFGFNGWGLKFAADRDNLITSRLHRAGAFGATPLETVGLILEGGSIESDGRGTILTTTECLLSPNRNPHLSRKEIERALGEKLGADRILWIENGYLAGDDTDSHIDTLARLAPDDTIVYVRCDDATDEHYPALFLMEKELKALRTREGNPYRLIPLPWPRPCHDEEGERLPATYANYLVINGAVLVPTYDDSADEAALAAIGQAFPGREIIGIDCRPLILQHGSLHCVTMQIPKGVLP